ncbi:NifB/NifX family molybdenum-iron cluster-binding protein [Draconibacterium sediminis]|uniref:NifB/NifX family molybdenum-iron cluster-binding protein n=1 Tax=Draconibacterium sediminis TaxID=1544798 RepID=UPI0026EA5A2A|nr:NifB/NifX family molybdenum-iron cluster-binding protein [Draconibacterium sediminis]
MKTIITSSGDNADAKFDLRFGRAAWFCVYDKETHTTNFIENSFKNSNGGAGTKSSEMAAELGAEQIISGHFGPKAKDMLEKFEIQMIELDDEELKVRDVISRIENN